MPESVRAFWKGSEKADMVGNDECRMANDEGFGNALDLLLLPLPGRAAAALDVLAQGGGEFVEDLGSFFDDVGLLLGVGFEVVEFEGAEGVVLHEFVVATDEGFVAFATVGGAAFAAGEVEVARGGEGLAFEDRDEADGVEIRGGLGTGEFEESGEEIEVQALIVGAGAGLDLGGPADHEGDAEAAVVVVLLTAAPRGVGLAVGEGAAVVGGEDDDGVVLLTGVFEGCEEASDAIVEVFDEGDIGGAFVIEVRGASFDFGEPFGGGFDGEVGGVVGEVEEEGLVFCFGA